MKNAPLTMPAPTLVKPRLRGVSHEIAFYLSLLSGGWLVNAAPSGQATWGALVHALSLSTLFGVSALYHRPTWAPKARARMRRLDHSAIFTLIAGTYTPICLLVVGGEAGHNLLTIIWAGAAIGVLKSLVWAHAPKALTAAVAVGLSWVIVGAWDNTFSAGLGGVGVALLITGGVLYTTGALVYALRWPNPKPAVFGYHEIFHALVIAAAACHFEMVRRAVLGVG